MSAAHHIGFEVRGNSNPLLQELAKARKAIDTLYEDTAKVRGATAAGGTDKIVQQLARERSAVEQHYSAIGRLAQNASRAMGGISLPGIGGLGALTSVAGIVATIGASIGKFTDAAKAVHDLSVETGASVTQIATLDQTAARFNVTSDVLQAGLRNLAESTKDATLFKGLGVDLKDAAGNARPLLDVFEDVRKKLAGASGDYNTIRVAQDLFGRSAIELLPLLRATDDEYQKVRASVASEADEMTANGVRSAQQYESVMLQLGNVMQNFGGAIVPFVVNAARGLGQAFDTLGTIVHNIFASTSANPFDFFKIVGESMDQAQTRADAQFAHLQQIGQTSKTAGGTDLSAVANRDANAQASQDATRKEMDALRKMQQARADALHDGLEVFQHEKQAQLDTIDAEEKARQKQHDTDVRLLQDGLEARERARATELRGIEDQTQQIRSAFDEREKRRRSDLEGIRETMRLRDRAAEAEIDGINRAVAAANREFAARQKERDAEAEAVSAQLKAMANADQAAQDDKAIADARSEITKTSEEDMTRIRSESLSDYQRRVQDHNARLEAAQTHLSDVITQITQRQTREQLQTQLDAIAAKGKADRDAVDASQQVANDQIDQIHVTTKEQDDATQERIDAIGKESEADRERTDAALAHLQSRIDAIHRESEDDRQATSDKVQRIKDVADKEKEAADAQTAGIRAAMKAEQERVDDAVKQSQRETQAKLDKLQELLDGATAAYGGIAAASASSAAAQIADANSVAAAWRNVNRSPDANDRNAPAEGPQSPDAKSRNTPATGSDIYDAFNRYLGHAPSAQQMADYLGANLTVDQLRSGIATSPEAQAFASAGGAAGALHRDLTIRLNPFTHDYPHSLTLREPTALIGASGTHYGTAAAAGDEAIAFGGVGGGGGGHGHPVYVNGRLLAQLVSENQGDHYAIKGGSRRVG